MRVPKYSGMFLLLISLNVTLKALTFRTNLHVFIKLL